MPPASVRKQPFSHVSKIGSLCSTALSSSTVPLMLIPLRRQRLGRLAGLCLLAGVAIYVWRAQG
ncbi:hypothetical protein RBY4I_1301 [Rhodobacterales bacterium Y4I]|nr:hypothetical protein RBY4I_1301 [Rhodobacterales bacterium Y4I]